MQIGLHLYTQAPLSAIRWLAYAARFAGLDALTVWDHYQHFIPQALWNSRFSWLAEHSPSPHAVYDPWTLLAYLARYAGNRQLGVLVSAPSRRHPVALAQAVLTLAHMTRRPPILGLGLGEHANTVPYGVRAARPVDQLEEALQILRRCFSSRGPFDFAGEHFQLDGAVMDLAPPPGRTPDLWVAAHGPRMLRLTGRYGDGWIPHIVFPDEYADKLARVHRAAVEAGRDQSAITPANEMLVAVARTERDARGLLGTRAARFSALLMPPADWQQLGIAHPLGEDFGGYAAMLPERYPVEVMENALRQVPVDVVGAFVLWGTVGQVEQKLARFREAGARHVALVPAAGLLGRRAVLWTLFGLARIRRRLR